MTFRRGYAYNSTLKAPTKAIPKRNERRADREFKRAYYSEDRILFVRSLPCIVTGKRECDNAHIETGGMGRKAHYTTIVPLRGALHRELHQIGRASFEDKYGVNLEQAAQDTQAAWLQFSGVEDVDA